MKYFALGTLLCLAAAPLVAQTACPTSADLARGIRIDFADGASEIYRTVGGGIITVTGLNPDGEGYQMELAQGMHLLLYQNTEAGAALPVSVVEYDYGIAPDAMPVPAPGASWQTAVTVTASDGPRSEPQKHVYGEITSTVIGACTYQMLPAMIAYATDDHYVEGVEYLPELGIGYLVWNEADDMDRVPMLPVGIAAVTK